VFIIRTMYVIFNTRGAMICVATHGWGFVGKLSKAEGARIWLNDPEDQALTAKMGEGKLSTKPAGSPNCPLVR